MRTKKLSKWLSNQPAEAASAAAQVQKQTTLQTLNDPAGISSAAGQSGTVANGNYCQMEYGHQGYQGY